MIDLPSPVRHFLVKALIVPFRSSYTSQAYNSIWTVNGSPLLDWTQKLASELSRYTCARVYWGMRYGQPNLADFAEIRERGDEILLAGLYPHHADSTRTTLIECAKTAFPKSRILVLKPFFDHHEYVQLCQNHLSKHLPKDTEHLLFSFHGLPLRQIRKLDTTNTHCLKRIDCCAVPHEVHEVCYRHQCLTDAANLSNAFDGPSTVCFQSRIGKTAWLEPYTEDVLHKLADEGLKCVSVYCPSFVSDNLETLYDIGEITRNQWIEIGGETLNLIPAINLNTNWIQLLADWCNHPKEMFEQVT